ncbi:Major Facilitator Superfamily protein [Penicillium brasilianum]|uniref:Major Facilitator Superfamily protein n=1 Tax=Penicillium brasilianum TaxID=104259 RepID=A0A1S9RCM9_PENBI|nr:Major Facilitator Superfamily protein [Penicillium brasilianum]
MVNDIEKTSTEHLEIVENSSQTKEGVNIDVDEQYSYEEQRKIIHRVDRRLVVICGAAYCISLMDRTNISVAAITGMMQDLELYIGFRYVGHHAQSSSSDLLICDVQSIMILVFFVTYIIFQPLAAATIRYFGPRIFISAIVMTWGACLIGFAYSPDWQTLTGLRALLGVFESGFFPGTVYLLSTWYSRCQGPVLPLTSRLYAKANDIFVADVDEVHKRYALFYLIGSVATAVSGILAFGFSQMSSLQGFNGWRWIFIMQAILTFVVGILCFIFVVDFPDKGHHTWGFLNESECAFIMRRINKDRGDASSEPFHIRKFLRPALDLKIWGFATIFFCPSTVEYAISYFLPIILRDDLGFGVAASQCLIAPPFVLAGIYMIISAWAGDKYRMRAPILIFNSIITLIGLPMMGFASSTAVRFVGVFLTPAGTNANIPAAMAYQANNIRGQWARAFASATLVGFGGIGGIAESLMFRSQDAPQYVPGIWGAIACQTLLLIVVAMMSTHFQIADQKADRGEKIIEGLEGFRYTI